MINIFIGNLDVSATEEQLRSLFADYGAVETVALVKDTGEPRGLAFIEMTQASGAQAAIAALNGVTLQQHVLRVNEARPKALLDPARDAGSRQHRRHQI